MLDHRGPSSGDSRDWLRRGVSHAVVALGVVLVSMVAACSSSTPSSVASSSAVPTALIPLESSSPVPIAWQAGCAAYQKAFDTWVHTPDDGTVKSKGDLLYATQLEQVAQGPARGTPLVPTLEDMAKQLRLGSFNIGGADIYSLCTDGVLPKPRNVALEASYLKAARSLGVSSVVTDADVIAAGHQFCDQLADDEAHPDPSMTVLKLVVLTASNGGFPAAQEYLYGLEAANAAVTVLCPVERDHLHALPAQ